MGTLRDGRSLLRPVGDGPNRIFGFTMSFGENDMKTSLAMFLACLVATAFASKTFWDANSTMGVYSVIPMLMGTSLWVYNDYLHYVGGNNTDIKDKR